MVKPDNFVINSMYSMDFLCGYWEGSYTTSEISSSTQIAHGLGFIPLCTGVYSYDGGTTWVPFRPAGSFISGGVFASVYSDADKVWLFVANFTGSQVTVNYRIFGFQPSDATSPVPIPAQTNDFTINTMNNYAKVVAMGKVDISDLTINAESTLVTHNLGYVPEALVWMDFTGDGVRTCIEVESIYYASGEEDTTWSYFCKTSSALRYFLRSSSTKDGPINALHYRIYGDQNG